MQKPRALSMPSTRYTNPAASTILRASCFIRAINRQPTLMIYQEETVYNRIQLLLALCLLCAAAQAQTPAVADKQLEVFGQQIHYLEAGSGPTVILLHGLGGDVSNWAATLPALAKHYHVYALDQIGFGQSAKPLIAYRVATLVDFLHGFYKQAGITKATLVGNSLGGWTAAAFTLAYPDKVDKLVLVDAAGYSPERSGMKLTRETLQTLNPATLADLKRTLNTIFYNKALITDATVEQFFAQRLKRGDGYTISQFLESALTGQDFLDNKVKQIKAPTLVVWGRQDELTPLAMGEAFAQDIAGAQKAYLDKCGHVPQLECAAAFNEALLKFLNGTTSGK
jgi:pimeloyl-ACP methyl ester carboxylesterase